MQSSSIHSKAQSGRPQSKFVLVRERGRWSEDDLGRAGLRCAAVSVSDIPTAARRLGPEGS